MKRTVSWLAGLLVGLVVVAGCGLGGNDAEPTSAAPVAAPAAEEVLESVPEPSESPTPKPSKSKARPKPSKTRATPTEDPNHFQLPACATRDGKAVPKKKAKSALTAAANGTYWPGSAPDLKLPRRLVLATAWQESGWTSNFVNCDGGRGLMQVMPDTEAFVNQRFEKSYDSHDYRQNATLGANYLAWLTKAFGDAYFKGSYDLSAKKCKNHHSMCLLNLVIAGYNAGRGPVDEMYADRELPNPAYVDSVRSLMKSCYCDKY
ncbi:lytic transglycosylase domain-containing protein [Actinoplanes sp. NPDC051346]|uniref:lytic transglycosylase domain-containing protein n=1 Tax=Actinoplanes sp. NPDC051346 TaxID=3155048 RepID=UPI0034337506